MTHKLKEAYSSLRSPEWAQSAHFTLRNPLIVLYKMEHGDSLAFPFKFSSEIFKIKTWNSDYKCNKPAPLAWNKMLLIHFRLLKPQNV